MGRRNSSGTPDAPPLRAPARVEVFTLDGEPGIALLVWPIVARRLPGRLTGAEREVLRQVLAGLSNPEIACRRGRSPRTIANQVASIFGKLAVSSRLELFARLATAEEDGG